MAERDDLLIHATPAPGRVRGDWDPDTEYVEDDLVCVRHTNWPDGDSWYICAEKNTNRHPERGYEHARYWKPSPWVNITAEYTQPEYRYQRVHSIHPEMIDEYLLGKGIPAWYYFDLLGFFNTRTQLLNVIDLLTTMRGTILGVRSFLNLINLHSELKRLAPEEKYLYVGDSDDPDNDPEEGEEAEDDEDDDDLSREAAWLAYMTERGYWIPEKDDCRLDVKMARYWNNYTDYNVGDLVYYNIYSGDRKHIGCALYEALRPIDTDGGNTDGPEPSGTRAATDAWGWVCGYEIKPMTAFQIPSAADNSRYRLLISQLAGRESETVEGRIMITKPEWQQIFSCYYARLIEFLIPAWIRVESGMFLLDRGQVDGAKHASEFNFLMRPEFTGIEPYTLTVLPHVGCFGERVSVTTVKGVRDDGSEFDLEEVWPSTSNPFQRYFLYGEDREYVSRRRMDQQVLEGTLKGYYWYEDYMPEVYGGKAKTLKVRVPALQKIKLRAAFAEVAEEEDVEEENEIEEAGE